MHAGQLAGSMREHVRLRRARRACHLSCTIAQMPMMTGNCLNATSSLPGVTPEMRCFESSQGMLQYREERTQPTSRKPFFESRVVPMIPSALPNRLLATCCRSGGRS